MSSHHDASTRLAHLCPVKAVRSQTCYDLLQFKMLKHPSHAMVDFIGYDLRFRPDQLPSPLFLSLQSDL